MIGKVTKNILKYGIFFCLCLDAKQLSFIEAWNEVLTNSNALKAKEENLKSAKFKQLAAKDLYWPDVSLSANYVHLNKPLEAGLPDMGLGSSSVGLIAQNIAKNSANSAYMNAIKSGKSNQEAQKAAQESIKSVLGSFEELQGGLKNSSVELLKQDVFVSSIRAIWPIFTGGRIEAAQIVANGETKEAYAIFEMAKQGQFEDLARIYFGVVLAKEVAKTKKEVENALLEHYEHSKKLHLHGQIAKVETLLAKASYDKARVDAIKAKRSYEIAQIALTNLLHVRKPIITKTNLFTSTNLPNMKVFLSKTLASYPGLKLLDAKKTQTKGLIKANKGLYYPEVFLFGNYSIYHDDSLLLENSPKWFAGVGINVPLISSKGRSGKLDFAHSKSMQVGYMYEEAKRNLSVLVKKTYKQTKQALEEFEGLNSSVELGHENVRLRKKSFMQGMATSLDVIDAQLFLQGVQTQRLVASYQYILSLSKLLALSNQIEKFSNYEKNGANYE